jgi:tetratricopeptide (TPR) repeat protein
MGKSPHLGATGTRSTRKWLSRALLALGAPVLFLLILEAGLRISGFGVSTDLFIPDEHPGYYRTNPHFTAPYFPPQFDITSLNFRIPRAKEAGHSRIFVLGESAVRGTPEPAFGFASQLAAQLRAAYPGRQVEVYNLGIVAINSHVVYQVARQVLALQPDLLVVYMGNNEVVGPYGPGSVNLSVMPPLALIRASIWISGTRTGQLVRRIVGLLSPTAVRSLEWRGMSTFDGKTVVGDDPRLEVVYRNFEANLTGIVATASQAGVRTVLSTVVANLKDSPPFASLHRDGMTEADLQKWSTAYAEGSRAWELGQIDEARRQLASALDIDPHYAEAHFVMARVLAAQGDTVGSRKEFIEALHWDALRFRPDPRINEITRKVAVESKGRSLLVDASRELGADMESTVPPSGHEILLEHVHFNWDGNVRMGQMLARACGSVLFGNAAPPGAWLDERGCAEAVGYTPVGHLRMLEEMEAIRGKAPFTGQLTFGEDQYRYQQERNMAADAAKEGLDQDAAQIGAALARSPGDPDLFLQLAEVEAPAGRHDRELESIDRALDLVPPSANILVRRARALAALQRGTEAEDAVLESLRIDAYNLPSYTALVETLRMTGDFARGRDVFRAALARNPRSAFIRLSYADLLFFHGDRDAAVGECRAVLEADPQSADALRRLASLYRAEGRKDDAFALMSKARMTQPLNFENDLALARVYDERGDEDHAAECLADAARGGPATAQVHLYLARHLKKEGKAADALLELARAKRLAIIAGDTELEGQITAAIIAAGSG